MATDLTARQAGAKVRRVLPDADVNARTTPKGVIVTVRGAGDLDEVKREALRYAALWGGFTLTITS
jgi:hypothetical protein